MIGDHINPSGYASAQNEPKRSEGSPLDLAAELIRAVRDKTRTDSTVEPAATDEDEVDSAQDWPSVNVVYDETKSLRQ